MVDKKSGYFCSPQRMFVTLGFFCSLHAEEFVLIPKLRCHGACRADTAFGFGNTHETLPFYAEDHFLCVLCTFVVCRTGRAVTHTLVFFLCHHHVFL